MPIRAKMEHGLWALWSPLAKRTLGPQTPGQTSELECQAQGPGIKGRKGAHRARNFLHLRPALLPPSDLLLIISPFHLCRLPWKDPIWDHFQTQASQGKELGEYQYHVPHTLCVKQPGEKGFLTFSRKTWKLVFFQNELWVNGFLSLHRYCLLR